MNKEQFEGNWNQIRGKIKEKWGKLTDDEITQIRGKREQLVGKLQTKYGYAKERAEEELRNFESSLKLTGGTPSETTDFSFTEEKSWQKDQPHQKNRQPRK